jgi:hypothetical protein
MNVLPRSSWTSHNTRSAVVADQFNGTTYNRKPIGISIHTPPVVQKTSDKDPVEIFQTLGTEAFIKGLSDIQYNLGVTNNADSTWNLRGLQNVSAASPDPNYNSEFVSIFVSCGTEEKPPDHLLRNLLGARRLVVSRYPSATQVNWTDCYNPYLKAIFSKPNFWEGGILQTPDIPCSEFSLPDFELHAGQEGVHVFDLQEQLAYWRYYRTRVDGKYNSQTIDAVTELQADLIDGKLYFYGIDGIYSDHLRRAWMKYLIK